MYEKLDKIVIGENKLPIKCNIGVLAYVQETYGTLSRFEQKLIGMEPILDNEGKYIYKADGTVNYRITEPSISVIKEVTPLFIREGMIQAENQGENYSDIEWEESFENFEFNYIDVALALNSEFQRCFHRKKKTNTRSQRSRTVKK